MLSFVKWTASIVAFVVVSLLLLHAQYPPRGFRQLRVRNAPSGAMSLQPNERLVGFSCVNQGCFILTESD